MAGLMVIAPLLLTIYLWVQGGLSFENLIYVLGGLIVMNLLWRCWVCIAERGMPIRARRSALVWERCSFCFWAWWPVLMMMVSFSGSFQVQLAPFLAFILGGGVGLYAALGAGNPSKAIAAASMLVPFATFYSITSFLLRHNLACLLGDRDGLWIRYGGDVDPSAVRIRFCHGSDVDGGGVGARRC